MKLHKPSKMPAQDMNAHFSTAAQSSNHVNNTSLYLQLIRKQQIIFRRIL